MEGAERNEISLHEVRVFEALRKATSWMTHKEIQATIPERISARTIRAHTLRFVRLGIVDLAEVFPAHRYRLSDKAKRRNPAYMHRLEKAIAVFQPSVSS